MATDKELMDLKALIDRESGPRAIAVCRQIVGATTIASRFELCSDPRKLEQLLLGAIWIHGQELDLDRIVPIFGKDCA